MSFNIPYKAGAVQFIPSFSSNQLFATITAGDFLTIPPAPAGKRTRVTLATVDTEQVIELIVDGASIINTTMRNNNNTGSGRNGYFVCQPGGGRDTGVNVTALTDIVSAPDGEIKFNSVGGGAGNFSYRYEYGD